MAVPSKLKPHTPQNDSKFLVFTEHLDELLHQCPTCGAVVSKRETSTRGNQLCVTLKCKNGHIKNGGWKLVTGFSNFTKWSNVHKNSIFI